MQLVHKIFSGMVNNVEPDQTDLGLHCLHMPFFSETLVYKIVRHLPYIISMAVAYLCIIAVQHFLNDPHGEINISNLPVPVLFNMAVCGVLIVRTLAL